MSNLLPTVLGLVHGVGGLEPVLCELESEWAPDVPPIVMSLSAIGRHVAEHADAFAEPDLRTVFERVERMLVAGTEIEKDAAATGFLEAVASVVDEVPERRWLLSLAGAASNEYLRSWDAFCGVDRDESGG